MNDNVLNDKVVQGKLIGFGHAPYKDDANNQPSYYVELETVSGKNKFWGLGLKEPLERNNIKLEDTIALLDKGIIEGTKKREWEVEKYEQQLEHKNSIEYDKPIEQEKKVNQDQDVSNEDKKKILDFKKDGLKDDLELPESIKNNYTAIIRNRLFKDESINFYDRDDKNNTSIAFEDRKSSLNTSRSDDKTIKAMLDIAESKSWSSISLKGTEEFKQKAWLEASIRGIKTKGYEPTEKDLAELQLAQQDRTNNKIQHEETTLKKDLDLAVPVQEVQESKEPEQSKEQEIEQDLEQPSLSLDQDQIDKDTTEVDVDKEPLTADEELGVIINEVAEIQDYLDYADKLIDQTSIGQSKISTEQGEILQSDRLKLIEHEFKNVVQNSSLAEYTKEGYIEEMTSKIKNLEELTGFVENKKLNGVYEQDYRIHFDKYKDAYDNSKVINNVEAFWNEKLGIGVADKDRAIEINDKKLSVSELATVGEVKNYIGKFLAEEVEKGNINSRDDVVNALKQEGFNVLKEETKTISIENPVGNRNIRLQGQMFEKGFNPQELEKEKLVGLINSYKDEVPLEAIQTVGVNKNTGMQNLRVTLDSYKDKIEEKDKVTIEAFKQVIEYKFKDNPLQMDKKLNDLADKVPQIADGTYQLPEPPTLKREATINVQVNKQSDKERGR